MTLHMNFVMYSIMMISSMMAISSTNMFIIWFSLELNMFCFIPLILKKSSLNEVEAPMNYFLAQALGSTLFLLSSSMLLTMNMLTMVSTILLISTVLLKMGAAPYHYWFMMTMEMISWFNCLLLLTWQKIAPLFILLYYLPVKYYVTHMMALISSMNAMTGSIMGLNQLCLKKIMACSSISHMGWILSGTVINMPCLSVMYFIIYSAMIISLMLLLSSTTSTKTNDTWMKQKLPNKLMIMITLTLLSLGGMPPLTGFIPKFILTTMLMKHHITLLSILITSSIMSLFFYLGITMNILISNQDNMKISHGPKPKAPMFNISITLMLLGPAILYL